MFPHCNPHYNTMDKPFSAGHTAPNSRKLDSSFSLPTFHHVDNISFNDILFNSEFGEIDHFSPPPPPPPLPPPLSTIQATKDIATPTTAPGCSKKGVEPGRRRALRKDRHSKIRTAQGLRDRRMRLSLEVAPEFFEIQDMLGHDKASKTLRWLITAAKPAIQELIAVRSGPKTSTSDPGASSKSIESSTSELAESVDMNSTVSAGNKTKSAASSRKRESDVAPKAKRACRRPPSRKGSFPTTIIAKEARLKARARARERTEKKSLLQSSLEHNLFPVNEDSSSHELKSSLDQLVAEVEEHCSHSPNRQQQLGGGETSNVLPVTIFDYNQNAMCPNVDMVNLLIHEQWDMERILQADAQLHGWEA